MKSFSSIFSNIFSNRRRASAAMAAVLLFLFLLRPGAQRLKSRIISSISAGVGRPVDLGSVHVRLLPRPGFDLNNLVVYDDPAFGAEPILRAGEVTADLRLISLLRGRMEIARLELTDPSLNLVHSASGRWNLEALLERTAKIPLAPTGKAKTEPRPGFPYIEVNSGRINFKDGTEKKPYALINADFSLWQESENSWGVRLKAQPLRTDMNLNDTGLLQVNGTWQRAPSFREAPVQVSVEWKQAQLGQFTKFFTGNDQGWRGAMVLDAALSGTPSELKIAGSASVEDFRRYDINSGKALRLRARCDAEYTAVDHEFHSVACSAPVGSGLIEVKGDVGLPGSHRYAIEVRAKDVPANAAAMLAGRMKKNLPDDLLVEGTIGGSFSMKAEGAAAPDWEGSGEIADLRMSSAALKAEIGPETIPVVMNSESAPVVRKGGKKSAGMQEPDGPRVEFGPMQLGVGRAGSPTVRGWINRSGYAMEVTGEADIAKTLRAARMAGIAAAAANPEGAANVDLQIAGSWAGVSNGAAAGFAGPQVTGSAKLRNAQVALRGTGGPIEIVSAEMQLLPDKVSITKLNAKAAGSTWTGSVELPRGCGTVSAACPIHFAANAGQIAFWQLRGWAAPSAKKRPWYDVLEPEAAAGPSVLGSLHASGRVTADRVLMQGMAGAHVSANVELDGGKIVISDVSGDFLGGKYRGKWMADFSVKPAMCEGSGGVTKLSLSNLANRVKGIAGAVDASYEVKGTCKGFWDVAEGSLQFDWRDGILPRVQIGDDPGALKITRMTGDAWLKDGEFAIENGKLDSAAGKFQVSGTATLSRDLNLKLVRVGGPGYTITGTLAEPTVTAVTGAEQARVVKGR